MGGGKTHSWRINPLLPHSKGFSKLSFVFLHSVLREPQLYKNPKLCEWQKLKPQIFFSLQQTDSIDFLAKKRMELAVNTVYWQPCSQTSWQCFLTSKLPPPPHRFFSSFHKPQRQKSTLPKLSETSCPDRDLDRNLWVAKKKKRKERRQDKIWSEHTKLSWSSVRTTFFSFRGVLASAAVRPAIV